MVKLPLRTATQFLALLVTIMFVITWTAWPALAQSASTSDEVAESESSASDTEDEPADSDSSESSDGGDSRAALIMDASDSMMAQDVDGGTRLDAAKQAANQLVDSLPETAVMGMLVYGASESNAPDNRERGCQDIDVLAPVERIDKEELKGEIDALEAQGYTPMGNALRAAADELGSEGERSIILVSDGIDTCAPPPVCEVAEELAGDGLDLAIHTVGFKADEAAQAELECISEISGGIYVEARTPRNSATSSSSWSSATPSATKWPAPNLNTPTTSTTPNGSMKVNTKLMSLSPVLNPRSTTSELLFLRATMR